VAVASSPLARFPSGLLFLRNQIFQNLNILHRDIGWDGLLASGCQKDLVNLGSLTSMLPPLLDVTILPSFRYCILRIFFQRIPYFASNSVCPEFTSFLTISSYLFLTAKHH